MSFWIQAVVGVALWVWLLIEMIRPDSLLDRPVPTCLGCQRYFIKAGCPVHDNERTTA